MLHKKADAITGSATTETFVNFFYRANREGWRLFVMEWTKAQVIGSAFFELNKAADNFNDIDLVTDVLYGLLGDQMIGD